MTKDLTNIINIIEKNIQYLKSCLDLTEAHITWGTKNVKEKYSKVKERLQNKIREQYIDKKTYLTLIKEDELFESLLNTPTIEEPTEYQFTPRPTIFNILSILS